VTALRPYPLKAGAMAQVDVFVQFPREVLKNGESKARIKIRDEDKMSRKETITEKEIRLVGPFS